MNGITVLSQFPEKTDRGAINKFMQRFYGEDSTSWNGQYRYHRHGFREYIPHRKLVRGVIILRKKIGIRLWISLAAIPSHGM